MLPYFTLVLARARFHGCPQSPPGKNLFPRTYLVVKRSARQVLRYLSAALEHLSTTEKDHYQYSSLYDDLGNYFRRLEQDGTAITDLAIVRRARLLIRTAQDERTVEALSSLDGLQRFAERYHLSMRQMIYNPVLPKPNPKPTPIDPPSHQDLNKKMHRGVPLRAEPSDGPRLTSIPYTLESPQDTKNHTQAREISFSVRDAPFTDSGYASLPHPAFPGEGKARGITEDSTPVPVTGTADDDSKTVYSAATTALPSLAHKSISEVCKDIHTKITRQMVNVDWASVSHTVPNLVKAFAIKLGSGTSSDKDRRIMHFVHQHHQ